ncbi:hypothetical protein Rifp1Sym_ca00160 [endosymbiont of Riftia pachyptila (vent Ph05)]|jgi:hypothetical protein|uniref:Uncharacterized protein n=1 Tax=endosymbiont of Riftia pachyptila (vent Ph05) TaxID=1048808 RepID=G2DEH6_9GAMM|nr:hypothetical protein Rifp1Sym_ca00160 [endosymbiont of Riftia pachyptila (vent Ph05)]
MREEQAANHGIILVIDEKLGMFERLAGFEVT